ncbi:MAG: hypothetical protein H7842_00340 [Gammaproteobacteria bacterium SHHR-1]|uniref:hypothetical protein n=1 Tax=Magnetovirga frankeli TaxID=947516 RepID=UPI00129403F5|nr:hypothetical protein D5125_10410 [gamma proteobacterium SS-5]
MPEPKTIPEEVLLARIEQSEQMRAFCIQVWRENPQLARQAGERVRQLMQALPEPPAPASTPK